MTTAVDYGDVAAVAKMTRAKIRAWKAAYISMRTSSIARSKLDGYATRARVTTANARSERDAEYFDKVDADLREWAATVDPVDVDALKASICVHDLYYGKCSLCGAIAGAA